MRSEELLEQVRRISRTEQSVTKLEEFKEVLRVYAGEDSSFYKSAQTIDFYLPAKRSAAGPHLNALLDGYTAFLENGLATGMTIERQAQIDVVSDILGQAERFLNDSSVHPAAPAMIIGAALEEFLRNWCEEKNLAIKNKPGIEEFGNVLRTAELISNQDMKDLTVWAGLRNHASHGEFAEIKDKKRVKLMLEGINLFMRKHGPED